MAATATRDQGKTAFVKEVLAGNAHANARFVNEAWARSGHDGTISQTLVNKMRSSLGLSGNLRGGRPKGSGSSTAEKAAYTGKKRGRKPKSAGVNGHSAAGNGHSFAQTGRAKTGGRPAQLAQIETEIDRLLFQVMNLGGLEAVEDSLRRTRRLLYQVLSGTQS